MKVRMMGRLRVIRMDQSPKRANRRSDLSNSPLHIRASFQTLPCHAQQLLEQQKGLR
jgi:hypothetical protein